MTMDFYNVAATVIPVLYLAAVYQANVMDIAQHPLRKQQIILAASLVAILGEAVALKVLAHHKAHTSDYHFVTLALILLAALLVTPPILTAVSPFDDAVNVTVHLPKPLKWLRLKGLTIFGVAVVALYFSLSVYKVV